MPKNRPLQADIDKYRVSMCFQYKKVKKKYIYISVEFDFKRAKMAVIRTAPMLRRIQQMCATKIYSIH